MISYVFSLLLQHLNSEGQSLSWFLMYFRYLCSISIVTVSPSHDFLCITFAASEWWRSVIWCLMTCFLHWFGPRLCLGCHRVRFNSSNEMVLILLFIVMFIRPYVGLATRQAAALPRQSLCAIQVSFYLCIMFSWWANLLAAAALPRLARTYFL